MSMIFGNMLRIAEQDLNDRQVRQSLETLYKGASVGNSRSAIVASQRELNAHETCLLWDKLQAMSSAIRFVLQENQIPDVLLEVVAKLFFKEFPDGEIWHIETDIDYVRQTFWKREASLAEKYGPSGIAPEENDLLNPVRMRFPTRHNSSRISLGSGLGFVEALVSAGVSIPLSMAFPFIWGTCVPTNCGIVIFLPNRPLDTSEQRLDPLGPCRCHASGKPIREPRACPSSRV
jgi:hypothetical protein